MCTHSKWANEQTLKTELHIPIPTITALRMKSQHEYFARVAAAKFMPILLNQCQKRKWIQNFFFFNVDSP